MDLEHPPGKTDFDVLREGHARVSAFYTEDNFNLGQWVGIQRASLSYIPISVQAPETPEPENVFQRSGSRSGGILMTVCVAALANNSKAIVLIADQADQDGWANGTPSRRVFN